MDNGTIFLNRKILEWEWFTDRTTLQIFLICLIQANYKDKRHKGQIVKRGEFVTSRKLLSAMSGMDVKTVDVCLKKLESTKELTVKRVHSKGLIIIVNNYDKYQKIPKNAYHKKTASDENESDFIPDINLG